MLSLQIPMQLCLLVVVPRAFSVLSNNHIYLYKYSLILLKMRKLVQFCKYTLYISSITLSYHECSRIRFSDSFLVVRGEIIYSSVLFRNLQSLSFLSEQKLIFDEMNIKLHVFRSMSILNQLLYLIKVLKN